jgi:hypothetical protein
MPHASDCATHNEPAMPNGPCDCEMSRDPPNGMAGVLKELAEASENCFPLAGTDVIDTLMYHGVATETECLAALEAHAPEMMAAQKIVRDPSASIADDKIPF